MIHIVLVTSLIVIIDQLIKIIVANNMILNSSIQIINDFFSITYVQNLGAAFSILTGNRIFLIFIAVISLIVIYKFFIKNIKLTKLDIFTYSLLFGGIIGNLLDRLIRGYVIDYLDFSFFGYDFPIFNLADIVIVISAFVLVITMYRGERCAKNKNWRWWC